jgi:hypothetical protein
MTKSTTFLINGGAGRIICAIPALEKYQRLNPDDDFKILILGWETLLWGHPTLQARTFSLAQKGNFDIVKKTKLVAPEPYYSYGYYNQELSMAEAFDELINHTDDHSDLDKPNVYVNEYEKLKIQEVISQYKKQTGKKKTLVLQPYGSSVEIVNGTVIDSTNRSLRQENYYSLVQQLSSEFLIFYFGEQRFRHPNDYTSVSLDNAMDLRIWLALISECDYFLGVDSLGQHMARALNKKGLVIMGSTFETNVSYPNYFKFYRNKNKNPTYVPIRITDSDSFLLNRFNDGIMDFDDSDISKIAAMVKADQSSNISNYNTVARRIPKIESKKTEEATSMTSEESVETSQTISYG